MNGGFGLPIALLEHGTGHPGPEKIDQPMTFYDYMTAAKPRLVDEHRGLY